MALGNIHLTPQLVQAVRDAVDILDVASEHTRLRKAGRRHSGLCPLHKEKTPSFSVDADQGLFYCFGCGRGGDAIKLHMLLTGDDFPAAIEALARRYGIPLPTRAAPRSGGRDERDLESVLEAASQFFRSELARSASARDYLERRRIPQDSIERFGLGYAPDGWRNLIEALHPRVPLDELRAAGLIARSEKSDKLYDRFRNRLMFPIRAASGRLVGFGGRTLGDDPAKYLNTSETERFRKGSLLYGLDLAKRSVRDQGRVLLVEGYFDVLGAAISGIDWVVASMGTALTPEQAALLARYADEVIVGYDRDVAGEKAYRRTLPLLLARGAAVRRADFGGDHDPDSLRLAEGPEAVAAAVESAPDAVLLEIDRSVPAGVQRDPRKQARAGREVTELLRPIGDAILRFGYARQAADRLGVPIELLWRQLGGEAMKTTAEQDSRPAASIVRSLEERVLQLLLRGGEAPLPVEALPPPEVFLDQGCRGVFEAFRALYASGDGAPPKASGVMAEAAGRGIEVDRLAGLLLEGSFAFRAGELEEAIGRLNRRWRQQRLRRLSSEISEAQREGDRARLEKLLKEKTDLSLSLHRPGRRGN